MNGTIEEYLADIGFDSDEYLEHYGTKRHSGRYPWGSGENPYQHTGSFIAKINELKKDGASEKEIADFFGLKTTQLRVQRSLARAELRSAEVARAKKLRDEGMTPTQIAREMGYEHESSIRSLLNEDAESRMNASMKTAEFLKKQIDEKGMIDVGSSVEAQLGVSKEKLNEALYILELEGYPTYTGNIPQVTNPGKYTVQRVVCPPGTGHGAIYNFENIHSLNEYRSSDDGETFKKTFEYPKSMDINRLQIRYAEEGGIQKDGVIELRRGVEDLSLGDSKYAQVRILVDNDRYLKGMAVYSDNMPDGVDVIFNTNKHVGTPPRDVLKTISKDPDNPFGSLIKENGGQRHYIDKDGKEQLSLINKRSDEGDWDSWTNKLSSQFLSKQNRQLIKQQLDLEINDRQTEFDAIKNLTNPTVKKQMLASFADDCDGAAVHLKAAALPRQRYQVILPLPSLGENQVYAPNFKDGETVALIRFPHGGTFEIPILTVNNRNREGKKVITPTAKDAVGINAKVAERLSGADFDGDTVMVVPCNSSKSKTRISSTKPLKDLEGFDPKVSYAQRPGMKILGKDETQKQMGIVSNLITDMTLQGATPSELARAVKHSMVVIDANKHKLDYKKSEVENGIAELKSKYQGKIDPTTGRETYGASTLISKAKSEQRVLKRVGSPRINPDGSLEYKSVVETYVDKHGKTQTRMQKSTKMMEAKDARELISKANTPQEILYAEFANAMKSMANEARREMINTGNLQFSRAAENTYKSEVNSLDNKMNKALSNVPKERQAQRIANYMVASKKDADPDLANDKAMLKKVKQQSLTQARKQVGASRSEAAITFTDREWEAIQAGAISENKLSKMLKYVDSGELRERATPRTNKEITPAQQSRISMMGSRGFTIEEIAQSLGVSASTVRKYL